MVSVKFLKEETYLTGFEIEGHANTKTRSKVTEDKIVCSAVSMLAQSTLYGIGDVLRYPVKYEVRSGYVKCDISNLIEKEIINCQVLLKTMETTINKLLEEENYRIYIRLLN